MHVEDITTEPPIVSGPSAAPLDGSFAAYYRRNADVVWRYARRMGVPSAALEDAVQDVFVVAYRRRGSFHGGSERAWLIGIARRIADRYRRGAWRTARRHEALGADPPMHGDLDDALVRRRAEERIAAFVGRLDDKKREVFAGHLAGLRAPEIAAALDLNLNTVYTRLRRVQAEFARSFGAISPVDETPAPPSVKRRMLAIVALRVTLPGSGATVTSIGLGGLPAAGFVAALGLFLTSPAPSTPSAIAEGPVATASTSPGRAPTPARVVRAPDVAAAPEPTSAQLSTEPARMRPRPTAKRARDRPAPAASTATPTNSADALSAEVAVVRRLRDAIRRGKLPEARDLLAQYRTKFPDGALRRDVARLADALGSDRVAVLGGDTTALAGAPRQGSP